MKSGDKVMVKLVDWVPGTVVKLTLTGAWIEIPINIRVWRLRKSIRMAE